MSEKPNLTPFEVFTKVGSPQKVEKEFNYNDPSGWVYEFFYSDEDDVAIIVSKNEEVRYAILYIEISEEEKKQHKGPIYPSHFWTEVTEDDMF